MAAVLVFVFGGCFCRISDARSLSLSLFLSCASFLYAAFLEFVKRFQNGLFSVTGVEGSDAAGDRRFWLAANELDELLMVLFFFCLVIVAVVIGLFVLSRWMFETSET